MKPKNPARAKPLPRSRKMPQMITPWQKRSTVQESVPYEHMYADGICNLGDNKYSVTFSFTDVNYKNTPDSLRLDTFQKYCYFLNAFDDTAQFQITVHNRQFRRTGADLTLKAPKGAAPELQTCIREYNSVIERRQNGENSHVQQKYLTVTIVEESHEQAAARFDRIDSDVLSYLKAIGCETQRLSGVQRIALLREMVYRPDDTSEISERHMLQTGIYGKDAVAPFSFDCSHEAYIRMGDYYYQVLFFSMLPAQLSDEILHKLTEVDQDLLITVNASPQDPSEALKNLNRKIKALETNRANVESRQLKSGAWQPRIPLDLEEAIESMTALRQELMTRNEKMFLANILILTRAKTKEELDLIAGDVRSKVLHAGCALQPFTFGHEDALNSVLPLGRNDTFVKRTLTTTSLAVFIPFNVTEILHRGGFSYGKNRLSHNVLCLNRKLLENPHGFIFGCSGSGKSTGAKLEIWECFHRTKDAILVIDVDGEFVELVRLLGGQVIDVGLSSTDRFNLYDINEFYGGEDDSGTQFDPVSFKADFILSWVETTLNIRGGIDAISKSIIDHCVREIYQAYRSSPSEGNVPTLHDFLARLKAQPGKEAQDLVSALDIYVNGSLNIFAGKTNVDVKNRLICFNLKHIGRNLKVPGITVIQDFCWNLITRNQALKKNTWLWNDEIQTSLKHEALAEWVFNSWKRGRKYGLIATGMTQETRTCLQSEEAKTMISNSEFVVLYRQKQDMVADLAQLMSLSDEELSFLLTCEKGTGLFKAGNSIVQFDNRFDKNTEMFKLISTDIKGDAGQKVG